MSEEERNGLIKQRRLLREKCKNKDKEIERLNKELENLEKLNNANYQSFIEVNNIINEFNKLIENEINESKLEEDYDRVDAMEYCLETLKELKGSDKE